MLLKFFKWWEDKLAFSLGFLVITHLIQIPHMYWAADLYLELGLVSNINPIIDFIFYGIDLIEIPAMVTVTISFVSRLLKKKT